MGPQMIRGVCCGSHCSSCLSSVGGACSASTSNGGRFDTVGLVAASAIPCGALAPTPAAALDVWALMRRHMSSMVAVIVAIFCSTSSLSTCPVSCMFIDGAGGFRALASGSMALREGAPRRGGGGAESDRVNPPGDRFGARASSRKAFWRAAWASRAALALEADSITRVDAMGVGLCWRLCIEQRGGKKGETYARRRQPLGLAEKEKKDARGKT